MANFKRHKLMVNPKLQWMLLLRVIVYWLACMATIEFFGLAWLIATEPAQPTFAAYFINYDWRAVGGRLLLATLLLVPIVWDMLIFSNRFAGPIFRMRRILHGVAQGNAVEQIQLRRGDYWQGFVDDLNAALQRLATQQISPRFVAVEQDEPTNDVQPDGRTNAEGLVDSKRTIPTSRSAPQSKDGA